nr:reverse transcriptase domain-containing protein [Tanacetum cinerariifolium]
MNTASTSGSGTLLGNTIANPKGELKAITTRSGLVTEGPTVPKPPKFINPEDDECVEETYTDTDHAEYNIKVPPLLDPRKFLIPCGFYELKCKALADLGASINLMPLSVWKKLGLPKLISTRMTVELVNRAICTPVKTARDVFVSVGKFTFPADFVIVDYESNPRVPLIFKRPFLRTVRALSDVHGEEMILRDGDETLTLNMRHDTFSYSNQPHKESINMINIYNDSYEDYLEDFGNTTSSSPDHLLEEFVDELALITFPLRNDDRPFDIESDLREIEYLLNHDTTKEMDSILEDSVDECNHVDPNNELVDTILEMFTDEYTLDYSSPPLYDDVDDDLVELESDNENVYDDPFDSKEDEIKKSKLLIDELDPPRLSDFLLSPSMTRFSMRIFLRLMLCLQPITRTKYLIWEMDSILEDSVDECNLENPNNDLVDTIPEMFTDKHTLDYSSPTLYDDVDDDLVELESDNDDVYDDPFDSKELKESKLLIYELDPPRSTPDKNVKKICISNASLILENFNPPLYELPFHKKVPGSETLLLFSSENEEKVFNSRILTFKGVHTSLLLELSHRGPKAFKVIKNFKIPMEIFPCSYGEDIRILKVPCLYFYPHEQLNSGTSQA